jgi:hypothetical protein
MRIYNFPANNVWNEFFVQSGRLQAKSSPQIISEWEQAREHNPSR